MDCSLSSSSVRGIFQARVLECIRHVFEGDSGRDEPGLVAERRVHPHNVGSSTPCPGAPTDQEGPGGEFPASSCAGTSSISSPQTQSPWFLTPQPQAGPDTAVLLVSAFTPTLTVTHAHCRCHTPTLTLSYTHTDAVSHSPGSAAGPGTVSPPPEP